MPIAARWYSAFPRLFLRSPTVQPKRNVRILNKRLAVFHTGDFRGLVTAWREGVDKALIKERNVSPDTPATRLTKAVKYVDQGRVSRATGLINSKGKAPFAEGMKTQMPINITKAQTASGSPPRSRNSNSASSSRSFVRPAQWWV